MSDTILSQEQYDAENVEKEQKLLDLLEEIDQMHGEATGNPSKC